MGNLADDLLMQTLRELRASVDRLQDGQDEIKDSVAKLHTRTEGIERRFESLQTEVKSDARRWGAVGGAATSFTAIVLALLKMAFMPHK